MESPLCFPPTGGLANHVSTRQQDRTDTHQGLRAKDSTTDWGAGSAASRFPRLPPQGLRTPPVQRDSRRPGGRTGPGDAPSLCPRAQQPGSGPFRLPLGAAGRRVQRLSRRDQGEGPQPSPGQHMPFKPKLLQAVSTGQGQGELWPQLSPRAWLGTPQALPLLGPPVVKPGRAGPGLLYVQAAYPGQATKGRLMVGRITRRVLNTLPIPTGCWRLEGWRAFPL